MRIPCSATKRRRLQPLIDQLRNAAPGSLPVDTIATINPSIATTAAALDQLILTTADPAERARLLTIRNDFLTQASNDLKEEIAAIEADFLDVETPLAQPGRDAARRGVRRCRGESVQARQAVPVGDFRESVIDGTFGATTTTDGTRPADFGGKECPDQLRFNAGVNFSVSLFRHRGIGTAAPERAAQLDLEARGWRLVTRRQPGRS